VKLANMTRGPIVRINPSELHCDDYNFVDEIYPSAGNRIRDKHTHFLAAFAGPLTVSTFATRDHEVRLQSIMTVFPYDRLLTLIMKRPTAFEEAPSASSFLDRGCSGMSQRFTRWHKRCVKKLYNWPNPVES
jgi:hypothetical protein